MAEPEWSPSLVGAEHSQCGVPVSAVVCDFNPVGNGPASDVSGSPELSIVELLVLSVKLFVCAVRS